MTKLQRNLNSKCRKQISKFHMITSPEHCLIRTSNFFRISPFSLQISLLLTLTAAAKILAADAPAPGSAGVQITKQDDRLRVEINGSLFTEYFFKNVPRPYCYPVIGPGDSPMTRNWPMQSPPDEEHDHPHHRSLWYAHGEINGIDFWSEAKNFGKTVHEDFDEIQSGKDFGLIRSHNKWVASDGKVVLTDNRTLRIYAPKTPAERMFDFEITFHASNGEVVFGDTKEGSMAMRLNESMRLERKKKKAEGHIINSEGVRDGETWGKRANWCDYFGPVNGRTVGVAIFDHPQNPRHPTWWHVRDYGLFAANPFGRHDFEKLSDKEAGNLKLPAGQSLTFRYRFYLHEGDEKQARVAEKYSEYISAKGQTP